MAGLVAGDAVAHAVPAIDLVLGRDKLVRAMPLGSFPMPVSALPRAGAAAPKSEVRVLPAPRRLVWGGAGRCESASSRPEKTPTRVPTPSLDSPEYPSAGMPKNIRFHNCKNSRDV
jgi:hypothetical protein